MKFGGYEIHAGQNRKVQKKMGTHILLVIKKMMADIKIYKSDLREKTRSNH